MQAPAPPRLISLDAFRGFIMLLMASSSFGIPTMAKNHPESWWPVIAPQFEHREWTGCALWDLIQPAFMFMVGLAMAFSFAKRAMAGDSFFKLFGHALVRAIVLILLGVMLASKGKPQTEWLFTNVLAQIGLGYLFLFLLWRCGWETQIAAVVMILVGYWAWFVWHPLPAIAAEGPGVLRGFFAHWNIHTNAAADFDRWFLNLFPRAAPYDINPGGYQTLNFIPSLATMTLGLLTGRHLHVSGDARRKCGGMIIAGILLLLVGTVIWFLVCPVVKRIWTPSWVLFSTGWVLLILALFHWLVEIAGQRRLVFPLVVVGMNSMFIYLMHSLCGKWIGDTLKTHFGTALFSGYWGPVMERCSILLVLWLLCWWLYRQRAFLRV